MKRAAVSAAATVSTFRDSPRMWTLPRRITSELSGLTTILAISGTSCRATATTTQVDIGGFFPGDTLGTPAAVSNRPQTPWYLVAGLTTNISSHTTNDFHYSFLRNWWQYGSAGAPPQLPGLGGALE